MDHRSEIREFLASRRARITPAQAGLPIVAGQRRVKGLRREEVAMLGGVSVDYYVRLERGNLAGVTAMGGADPQVRGHAAANLNVGNTRADLLAVITALLPYIGYPRTLNALAAVDDSAPNTHS